MIATRMIDPGGANPSRYPAASYVVAYRRLERRIRHAIMDGDLATVARWSVAIQAAGGDFAMTHRSQQRDRLARWMAAIDQGLLLDHGDSSAWIAARRAALVDHNDLRGTCLDTTYPPEIDWSTVDEIAADAHAGSRAHRAHEAAEQEPLGRSRMPWEPLRGER